MVTGINLTKNQIIYGFETPDGKTFYVPRGIRVLEVRPTGVKLLYQFGDTEIVNIKAKFYDSRSLTSSAIF